MHKNFSRISVAAFAIVAGANALAAQTGSIAGTVIDKNTKQPIEQAMVTVQGTSYGIYTKANGTYTILGVPPGTYTVTAKRVGYQSVDAQNVTVRVDAARVQDFELAASANLGMVTIQAPPVPISMQGSRPAIALAGSYVTGPGAVFGIDGYECANCGVARYRDSTHAVYTFGAEPVVVSVSPQARDRIRPGDVIVAVNGNPITTRAGADMFAYPDSGEVKLTLRRNGTNIDIVSYSLNSIVPRSNTVQPVRTAGGRGGAGGFAASGGGGRGVAQGGDVARANLVTADSALRQVLDSARARSGGGRGGAVAMAGGRGGIGPSTAPQGAIGAVPTSAETISSIVELRNYGFTLSCRPDCTRMRSRTGALYWKFDGYPTVAVMSLMKGGLAEKAGIREGDVLISVNALSPLSEEGAVLLNRTDRELELTLEFSRAGKREKYVLKL